MGFTWENLCPPQIRCCVYLSCTYFTTKAKWAKSRSSALTSGPDWESGPRHSWQDMQIETGLLCRLWRPGLQIRVTYGGHRGDIDSNHHEWEDGDFPGVRKSRRCDHDEVLLLCGWLADADTQSGCKEEMMVSLFVALFLSYSRFSQACP